MHIGFHDNIQIFDYTLLHLFVEFVEAQPVGLGQFLGAIFLDTVQADLFGSFFIF